MNGLLVVWGNDSDGFWKRNINCHSDDIESILSSIDGYEDYDFEEETDLTQ